MRTIFKFPDIGEGLEEGIIAEWYVVKGQQVEVGDPLCKMETDKVTTDIPSPKSGTIAAIYGKIGETIHVGDPLAEIDTEDLENNEAPVETATLKKEAHPEEAAGVVGTLEIAGNNAYLPASEEGMEMVGDMPQQRPKKVILATPVARAMAKEMGIDIQLVRGTGPAGRVMKEDIRAFSPHAETIKNLQGKSNPNNESMPGKIETIPLSQLRKTIARNMIRSKQNAAHMTVFDEVEISELVKVRNRFKDRFTDNGITLSYLPFVIKAVALALKNFKMLNSEMDMENNVIICKKYYNIGIAVDTPEGLVVPVIRDADLHSIYEIATQVYEAAKKARNRELTFNDMKDGTFTITSFGSIGGMYAVPVINYPQAGILGVGRLLRKPVVKDEQIIPGDVLPLSVSVDHRIVDGGDVARFLNKVMQYLEDPISLMMD